MTQLLPDASTLAQHAQQFPEFAAWQAGYGPIQHSAQTSAAVFRLAHQLVQAGLQPDLGSIYRRLLALDRLTAAGLWLVIVAVIFAAVSVYYYFRVIQAMYFKDGEAAIAEVRPSFRFGLVLLAALIVAIGVMPSLLLNWLYF